MEIRAAAGIAATTLLLSLPTLSVAQQTGDTPTVAGIVLDAQSSEPVSGAYVRSLTTNGGVLTDREGRFTLPVRDEPLHYVAVTQLGYAEVEVEIASADAALPVEIEIAPDPIAMEELRVFHDRYEARRNRYAGFVWALDAEDLDASGADDALELVMRRAHIVPCGADSCAYSRGRRVPVEVWVDERPLWGDLDWLDTYPIEDLYLVEIFDRGRMIRLYTREEVARNTERLSALAIAPLGRGSSYVGAVGLSSWDAWPSHRAPRSLW